MSNINKQSLREAAEKATPRLWVETCGEVTTADYEGEGVTLLDHIFNCEIIGTESQNAEFIAAANPATVLAPLDELEAAEKRIAELQARELVVNLPAYVDGRTLGYGEVNHMIDLCADAIEKAGYAAGIITKVGGVGIWLNLRKSS